MKLNRIKAALAENQKTNKWLAEKLGKSQVTVSRWCSQTAQPSLQDLNTIAELLDVDVKELLISNKQEK